MPSPKRARKRRTSWGVREISGTSTRAAPPSFRVLAMACRYTSVLPLPVTPCSRKGAYSPRRQAGEEPFQSLPLGNGQFTGDIRRYLLIAERIAEQFPLFFAQQTQIQQTVELRSTASEALAQYGGGDISLQADRVQHGKGLGSQGAKRRSAVSR